MSTRVLTFSLLVVFALAVFGCASNNPEGQTTPPTQASGTGNLEKDSKNPGRGMSTPAEVSSE